MTGLPRYFYVSMISEQRERGGPALIDGEVSDVGAAEKLRRSAAAPRDAPLCGRDGAARPSTTNTPPLDARRAPCGGLSARQRQHTRATIHCKQHSTPPHCTRNTSAVSHLAREPSLAGLPPLAAGLRLSRHRPAWGCLARGFASATSLIKMRRGRKKSNGDNGLW